MDSTPREFRPSLSLLGIRWLYIIRFRWNPGPTGSEARRRKNDRPYHLPPVFGHVFRFLYRSNPRPFRDKDPPLKFETALRVLFFVLFVVPLRSHKDAALKCFDSAFPRAGTEFAAVCIRQGESCSSSRGGVDCVCWVHSMEHDRRLEGVIRS